MTSPLLASEQEIHTMDDNELNHLAKTDVLCHHLAQQAQFGDAGQEASCSLPGVVNLHLHVMHSLGMQLLLRQTLNLLQNINLNLVSIVFCYCKVCCWAWH